MLLADVTAQVITVTAAAAEAAQPHRWGAWSLVPPLLAIGLAIAFRRVVPALFVGVFSGALILARGNPLTALLRTVDTYLAGQLVDLRGLVETGELRNQEDHLLIISFTMFLGAMIGVMSASGATAALVSRLSRFTDRRQRGQLLTATMGLAVFFDDYANTLLVGSTMRPVTDRLRISREKLAFLVDSTAAPIAGLALVSTWVGFEIGQIEKGYESLPIQAPGLAVFVATIPFRFYAIYLLVFVFLVSWTGRDFGPMWRAEDRATSTGQLVRPGAAAVEAPVDDEPQSASRRPLIRNAVVPLSMLVVLLIAGLWWWGAAGLRQHNLDLAPGSEPLPVTLANILRFAPGNWMLFGASWFASVLAVLMTVAFGSLRLGESLRAWIAGARSMLAALLILLLAWGVAAVCDDGGLGTADYVIDVSRGWLVAHWVPALVFVISAAISFATGSSFSTMALLLPLAIEIAFPLLTGKAGVVDPQDPLMLATIGGVLAGSIFGDHCSPISDTTVLSSAATRCNHLDHVMTQMPYAATVAGVALLIGYVPAGFGVPPLWLLPLGCGVLFLIVRFVGRPVEG